MKNLLEQVIEEMKEHRVVVTLPGEKGERVLYLLMLKRERTLVDDFLRTYEDEVTDLHLKLFKKAYGEEKTENEYGVFVDDKAQLIFVFNREFADYDRKKKKLRLKSVDDVVMEKIEPGKPVEPVKPELPGVDPVPCDKPEGNLKYGLPSRPDFSVPSGNKKYGLPGGKFRPNPEMTFRYAITEKGEGKKKKK